MDLSHLQEAISEEASPKMFPVFTGPYHPQNWSIPDAIIYYILKNPSSTKVYQKMIQICKYFFFKNPIIVGSLSLVDQIQWKIEQDGTQIIVDLYANASKLWILQSINIFEDNAPVNFISSIIPKFYRCDAENLFLSEQQLSFNEFIFLAANAQDLKLKRITVKHGDGTIATLEELVEIAVKAKSFKLEFVETGELGEICPRFSSDTMKNLIRVQHFSKMEKFMMFNCTEDLDIEGVFGYIKKNKTTKIALEFSPLISLETEVQIETFIDEIIEAENHNDYKPPLLKFHGLDLEKYKKLRKIFFP